MTFVLDTLARRSIKGSIDADDRLVSKRGLNQKMTHWFGVQGQWKFVKFKNTPTLWPPPGEPQTQIPLNFFDRN